VNFASFNLHSHILSGVHTSGYKTPTPIQFKSIPPIMAGEDVMGLAQTGTGKTAAFVLPILHRLMEGPRGNPRALVIAPTRELAQQILEAFNTLGKDTKLRCVSLYGGININSQKQKLRRGAEIIVACPGRLLDHVGQRSINLSKIETVVLDEADQMFDMGFLPNIRKILQLLPKKRQSLLFSATMPPAVRQLTQEILHEPVTVQIDQETPKASIKQLLYPVPQHLKTELVIHLLQNTKVESVLIFTRTKHRAVLVAQQLEEAGYRATSLQSNLSQAKRQSVMQAFRSGALQILVATDIASRGIDVARISHVINYDMPGTTEAYTHRIGRTGRATKIGDALTLIGREDMGKVRSLERMLGMKLEQRIVPDFDYKAKTPWVDHSSVVSERERPAKPAHHQHRAHGANKGKPKFAGKPSNRTGGFAEKRDDRSPAHTGKPGSKATGFAGKSDRRATSYAGKSDSRATSYTGKSDGRTTAYAEKSDRRTTSYAGKSDRSAAYSGKPGSKTTAFAGKSGGKATAFAGKPGNKGTAPAGKSGSKAAPFAGKFQGKPAHKRPMNKRNHADGRPTGRTRSGA